MAGQVEALTQWALPRLSSLLPLDEDSFKQIISYTDTLPKQAASEHLKNLLGDSPQALEFISSFNTRRPTPPSETANSHNAGAPRALPLITGPDTSESEAGGVPRARPRQAKKKGPLNKLPAPRRPDNFGDTAGGYKKGDQGDYMAGRKKEPPLSNTLSLDPTPAALQVPLPTTTAAQLTSTETTPSSSAAPSRTASPSPAAKPKTKSKTQTGSIKFMANTKTMHAPSSSLNDLDAAIRTLESTTNPSLPANSAANTKARTCNCQAQRHALLTSAPNCLNCGKIICAKEGMGPCTYCGVPLLKSADLQEMIRTLKEERGKERQNINNAAQKKAEVSQKPRPFANTATATSSATASEDEDDAKLAAARQHRNKLLSYQSQNTKRTTIHDEAADFATPDTGTNIWASPTERALQLKKQQKVLREQEWHGKQEYEKRRVVLSLDPVTGKAVRRMEAVERLEDEGAEEVESEAQDTTTRRGNADNEGPSGFAANPFMGQLIRPVYTPASNGTSDPDQSKGKARADPSTDSTIDEPPQRVRRGWRAAAIVQDDKDDNEAYILDGGAYGDRIDGRVLAAEEPACG